MTRALWALGWSVAVGIAAAACSGAPSTPLPKAVTQSDTADQVMFGVKTNVTDAGLLRARLAADTVFMYNDNTLADLRTLTAEFFSGMGAKTATLTARTGLYNVQLGWMEARGDAVVITEDGRKLESPHLKYDPQKNEISSDSAFVLTEVDRVTRGIGFTADPDLQNVRVIRGWQTEGQRVVVPPQ